MVKFDKEALFIDLVSKSGLNLFLGAGFSVYAYNSDGQSLPLGEGINEMLINLFSLDKKRKYSLNKTCQKIKKDNEDALTRILKEKYTVRQYNSKYGTIPELPIKNIVTINIDNLVERIYDENSGGIYLSDSKLYGSLEDKNSVNYYKIHGSVTYPITDSLLFTEKETTDLFLRDKNLFNTISYKLSTAPTIFWGTSLQDNNTIELVCSADVFAKEKTQRWIVVYPSEENDKLIDDFKDLGFNIIEADTLELVDYLYKMDFGWRPSQNRKYKYEELFSENYISDRLKKSSVRRPVVDFFAGAEPQISDILSNNVIRIGYYSDVLNLVIKERIVLVTGIPGCGKSTLLLQLAFSNDIDGAKFWFSSITKQEAERLRDAINNNKETVYVFIDNLCNNMEAFKILSEVKNIKLVVAERALNFDYVKRSFNIDSKDIIDISNLNKEDIQSICKNMKRPGDEVIGLIEKNKNISLLEIVFYASTKSLILERIKRYINDLRTFNDSRLRINLLELFGLVNYTSYCGVPCSMDMLLFYFSDDIEDYKDVLYALKKMTQIIVEADLPDDLVQNQDYLVMRSKLFAEKTLKYIDKITMARVLNRFWDSISPHIVYRYDVFKKKAYDADITEAVFGITEGKRFYEKLMSIDNSAFVKHQYAIFLLRKKKYDLAWIMIDQAYTESEKKVFSIANTHAVILFEMNIEALATTPEQIKLLKETLQKSFKTLGYCITQDIRINYHVLVYSRNTIRYYKRFGVDEYTKEYINSSIKQLDEVLDNGEYMYEGLLRDLQRLREELNSIRV